MRFDLSDGLGASKRLKTKPEYYSLKIHLKIDPNTYRSNKINWALFVFFHFWVINLVLNTLCTQYYLLLTSS